MTKYYSWSVDGTQSDSYQVTIMIFSGPPDKDDSEYIGEFTMFFDTLDDIKVFLDEGQDELCRFKAIDSELRSLIGEGGEK